MLTSISKWWNNRKHKKVIKNIRGHMSFFGCDISQLTDEEIEDRFILISQQMGKMGITGKQAARALHQLIRF